MRNLASLGMLSALALTACQPEILDLNEGVTAQSSASYKADPACSETYTLYAGQTINVGDLEVSNDNDSIYVTYTVTGGWELVETHLYVGDMSGLPANKAGNPKIGNFPHKSNHSGVTSFTYAVAIDPSMSCYIVAAHASVQKVQNGTVVQSETAWSEGAPLTSKGSWATFSDYCLLDCCQIQTVQFDMFGGQAIPVGTLDVTNDATNLYVTYTYTGGWSAEETHLYVGAASGLPKNGANTPVPGQFPYKTTHNPTVTSYTYTIPLSGLDPCFIIAAHGSAVNANGGQETTWSYGTAFPGTNRWGWYSDYCTQSCM